MAAGLSSRMGQPKQLLPLSGQVLIRYAAKAMCQAEYSQRLVIIPSGSTGEKIKQQLADLPLEFVVNPDTSLGLLSSFKVAINALPAGLAAAAFALADMPFVRTQTHQALLAAFNASQPALVVAQYGEIQAPPHLFRADLLQQILALPDTDYGPKQLIKKYQDQTISLTFSVDQLLDVDTPEALAKAEQFLSGL